MNKLVHVGGNRYVNGQRFLLRTVNIFQNNNDKKYYVTFTFDEKDSKTICYEYALALTSKFEARKEVGRILNDSLD